MRAFLAEAPNAQAFEFDHVPYRLARFETFDLGVGLATPLVDADAHLHMPLTKEQPALDADHYAGRDGILIELGDLWSTLNMRLEPQERRRPA